MNDTNARTRKERRGKEMTGQERTLNDRPGNALNGADRTRMGRGRVGRAIHDLARQYTPGRDRTLNGIQWHGKSGQERGNT